MKLISSIVLIVLAIQANCQILSGEYDYGLKIAFNPGNKLITGYYENYTGFDETTGNPKFSCIFYIKGFYNESISEIETFYPKDKEVDIIKGSMKIIKQNSILIKLNEEHGGCWNVMKFADDFAEFKINIKRDWLEIRYIDKEKSYFYKYKNEATKLKSYLIKGDVIYIDRIENNWVHCIFNGKKKTEGWIKKETLNN
jgi:hypothetical protein